MKNATKAILETKAGKANKSVINMLANCRFAPSTKRIYTGYYSGSGRFTSAHSAIHTVTDILAKQGYKYTTGNDAPKGGASGEYVQVSKAAFNFIYDWYLANK